MDGLKARLSFDAVAYDYDDEYLTIDTDTHTININNVSRLFGVQYDGNSKLIKFRIRNKLSDIQKMQDSIVYINWIDSKGVKGQSIAINKTTNNDTCEFAWKIPFDALKNSGVLHFAMSAVMTKNSSSVIDQRWSTQIASVITPDGIYIKSYTPSSEEEDRIAQIYNELSNMINKQNDNLQSQVNSLNEDIVELRTTTGTNLHNKETDKLSMYINTSGVEEVNNLYWSSDFIRVTANETFIVKVFGVTEATIRVYFYDKSKKFINRIVNFDTALKSDIPSNAEYVRLSMDSSVNNDKVLFTLSNNTVASFTEDDLSYYTAFDRTARTSCEKNSVKITELSNKENIFNTQYSNLLDSKYIIGYWTNGTILNDGSVSSNEYNNRIVTYDLLKSYEEKTYYVDDEFNAVLALYNPDGTLISRVVGNQIKIENGSIYRISIFRKEEIEESADILEFIKKVSCDKKKLNYLPAGPFINGTTSTVDGTLTQDKYRIVNKDILYADNDILYTIAGKYGVVLTTYTDRSGSMINRKAKIYSFVKIPNGCYYRLSIYKFGNDNVEDTNITADVNLFRSALRKYSPKEFDDKFTIFSNNQIRKPLITIIDDDGRIEFYKHLKPIMEQYHIPISCAFINANSPNYMNWQQLAECVKSGAEVLAHGFNPLTSEEVDPEYTLASIKVALEEHGYEPNVFVYPEGKSDVKTRALCSKYYDYAIRTSDQEQNVRINTGCVPHYYITRCNLGGFFDKAVGDKAGVNTASLDYMKSLVDECIQKNGWLVFMTHVENMTTNKFQEYADIDQIKLMKDTIEYIQTKNVDIVTVKDALDVYGNVLQAGDYLGYWNTSGLAISKTGEKDGFK